MIYHPKLPEVLKQQVLETITSIAAKREKRDTYSLSLLFDALDVLGSWDDRPSVQDFGEVIKALDPNKPVYLLDKETLAPDWMEEPWGGAIGTKFYSGTEEDFLQRLSEIRAEYDKLLRPGQREEFIKQLAGPDLGP